MNRNVKRATMGAWWSQARNDSTAVPVPFAHTDERRALSTSSLLAAAHSGSPAAVAHCLRSGTPVDGHARALRPEPGLTPLLLAVQRGHVAVAELLLRAGARPDARIARGGEAALHSAAGVCQRRVVCAKRLRVSYFGCAARTIGIGRAVARPRRSCRSARCARSLAAASCCAVQRVVCRQDDIAI